MWPTLIPSSRGSFSNEKQPSQTVFVGNASGNLMAMHSYLGGEGKGPVNYGDMAIFTISDKGTEKVEFSRFGG